jgi:hypothetical protein
MLELEQAVEAVRLLSTLIVIVSSCEIILWHTKGYDKAVEAGLNFQFIALIMTLGLPPEGDAQLNNLS